MSELIIVEIKSFIMTYILMHCVRKDEYVINHKYKYSDNA
jgi:hypothetical protein